MEYQAADNRPQTTVDSPRQVDLDFKPCIVWLLGSTGSPTIARRPKFLKVEGSRGQIVDMWIYADTDVFFNYVRSR